MDLCGLSPEYFAVQYSHIYDPAEKRFIPFDLWPAQSRVLNLVHENQRVAVLKARQLGLTWVALVYALWLMLFRPAATVLLFSKRENEAWYLLGEERLRGMYKSLPPWMKYAAVTSNSVSVFSLDNGSIARAFPTTAGDSYTATFAVADEFDLVPDQEGLLRAVGPTIENGGKFLLISRADKDKPDSPFKKTFQMGQRRQGGWVSVFLPWHVHPGRTMSWYRDQQEAAIEREGTLDPIHEQYPATPEEAMQPPRLSKRFNPDWVTACYVPMKPLSDELLSVAEAPAINGLKVFRLPKAGEDYVIGGDTAGGKTDGDSAAITVMRVSTGEQVACYDGHATPEMQGGYVDQLGRFYNNAQVMIERNSTGGGCILWLRHNSPLLLLHGHDADDSEESLYNMGWLSSDKGKVIMYTEGAERIRDRRCIIHDEKTYRELQSIERNTLRAPTNQHDDCSDAFVLALCAVKYRKVQFNAVW